MDIGVAGKSEAAHRINTMSLSAEATQYVCTWSDFGPHAATYMTVWVETDLSCQYCVRCFSRQLVNVGPHRNGSFALCSFRYNGEAFDIHSVEWSP